MYAAWSEKLHLFFESTILIIWRLFIACLNLSSLMIFTSLSLSLTSFPTVISFTFFELGFLGFLKADVFSTWAFYSPFLYNLLSFSFLNLASIFCKRTLWRRAIEPHPSFFLLLFILCMCVSFFYLYFRMFGGQWVKEYLWYLIVNFLLVFIQALFLFFFIYNIYLFNDDAKRR